MSQSYRFDLVDALTPGAIGEPGQRVFYLQLAVGQSHVTFRCEKAQVTALAESFRTILADLPDSEPAPNTGELLDPIVTEWIVAGIGLAHDADAGRIVVQLSELTDDDGTEPANARFTITPDMAVAFCMKADELVAAGRPPCIWCLGPVSAGGHVCVRMN